MSRQDQGTVVSLCPTDCTTQGDTPELGPPHTEQIPTVGSPENPSAGNASPDECPSVLGTKAAEHPAWPWSRDTSPRRGDPGSRPSLAVCGKALMSRLHFAHLEQLQVPELAKGRGHRARSRLGRGRPDDPPWRAALTSAGGFALAPTPRSRAAERPSCPRDKCPQSLLTSGFPGECSPGEGGQQTQVKWIARQSPVAHSGHEAVHGGHPVPHPCALV